jgi:hypothetical protein
MTLTKPKATRPTTVHRKRSGQHHRQSRHYIKAYWPYLPIFAVLGLGIILNGWIGRAHHNVLGYATNVSSQVLLTDTNTERIAKNEAVLRLNTELTAAAQAKANDMAARGYWSHVSPDGKQPWSFVATSGYNYQAAGENLAYGFGSSDEVINAWMHSPEHRANILNADYQDVGFATANAPSYQGEGAQTIIVALYGEPASVTPASASVNSATPINISNQTQAISRLQLVTTATWVQLALAALCGAALMLFFVRHTFAWHKVLVRGEQFALHHPLLDTFLISAAVFAFLLSHAAGSIL